MGVGLEEQERAQAPLLLRPAADHDDLARLKAERRGKVSQCLLLLPVVDLELLRSIGRGVGHGLIGALDRTMMDLGREPERDSAGPIVGGGHAEVAAGRLVILAGRAVLPVQEEADLIDGITDADQRLIAVIEEKRRGLDLVRRRRLEDGFQFGWQLAGDLADSQAVDLQGSAGLRGDRLLIGRFPDSLVDRGIANGAIHDRHAEHAFPGLDDLPALAADSPEQGLGPKLIPVRITSGQAEQASDHQSGRRRADRLPATGSSSSWGGILSASSRRMSTSKAESKDRVPDRRAGSHCRPETPGRPAR